MKIIAAFWFSPFLLCSSIAGAVIEPSGFDSEAIEKALEQSETGDTIQLHEGVYRLNKAISVPSQRKLIGAGQAKTRLLFEGKKAGVLVSLNSCEDVELAHLTLDGENNPLVHQGIGGRNARRLWLHHLTIRNLKAKTWGPHGILFSGRNPTMEHGVTDSRISDCLIENVGLDAKYGGGIRLAWGSMRNRVEDNVIRNTGRGGIYGDHSAELVIRRNRVSGSGGTGLGIELWGGCPRSLIEDNTVDHWISVDHGNQSAVRRNTIGTDDGTLKGYGIEIIARDVIVTDNVVTRGAKIGLSVSNKSVKDNVYWGYNTISDCVQWGAQLQGEKGGGARHYFYECVFEDTVRGDPRARYPRDSGHGFRINGNCQSLVFDHCEFRNNGGLGFQPGGVNVDRLAFVDCVFKGNGSAAVSRPHESTRMSFLRCQVSQNRSDQLPAFKAFSPTMPNAAFEVMNKLEAGKPIRFRCTSTAQTGDIVERLWDFGEGIPGLTDAPTHTFEKPGEYRVTLAVWDSEGHGARIEKTINVAAP